MDAVVDEKKLKELIAELAKDVKTEKDLGELSAQLTKMTVEAALGACIAPQSEWAAPISRFLFRYGCLRLFLYALIIQGRRYY